MFNALVHTRERLKTFQRNLFKILSHSGRMRYIDDARHWKMHKINLSSIARIENGLSRARPACAYAYVCVCVCVCVYPCVQHCVEH